MKASFLRNRRMTRGVLVLDGNLASLEPLLISKKFRIINLPTSVMDAERKALFLTDRTLITKLPQDFEYEVPVLEFSIIDGTGETVDDATLGDFISRAWTRFRLKSEGYFILRLRQDGDHKIEFPEWLWVDHLLECAEDPKQAKREMQKRKRAKSRRKNNYSLSSSSLPAEEPLKSFQRNFELGFRALQ